MRESNDKKYVLIEKLMDKYIDNTIKKDRIFCDVFR